MTEWSSDEKLLTKLYEGSQSIQWWRKLSSLNSVSTVSVVFSLLLELLCKSHGLRPKSPGLGVSEVGRSVGIITG